MGKHAKLSYCAELVRALARDRFFLSLYVVPDAREALFTLYAFDAELLHVHAAVTEEINAHIRYAWWQESIDAMHQDRPPREHPVLQALASLMQAGHLPYETLSSIISEYREHYPLLPQNTRLVDEAAETLVTKLSARTEKVWRKAKSIIEKHRTRYGQRKNARLYIRLMLIGVW